MLVWNHSTTHKAQPSAQPRQKPRKDATRKLAPAKPGTKAYMASNTSECETQADHPKELHICAY